MQRILGAALLSVLAVGNVSAAIQTLDGTNIVYKYDDAQAAIALFGTPTIVGDTVRFLPPSFRAESLNGAGTDIATANFIFTEVYSKNGDDIMKIEVIEFGDYDIDNDAEVEASVLLTATSNDISNPLDFTSGSDMFSATGDSGGLQTWLMDASVNPEEDFIFGPANNIALSLQNTLKAIADYPDENAWIQKKLSLVATTAAVPVPAAAWLFGSALGLLGWMRRKSA